jgi:type IV secretory pathway VirB10-like protein
MNQLLLGGILAIATIAALTFFAMSYAQQEPELPAAPPPPTAPATDPEQLPDAGELNGVIGPPPPNPPAARQATREEKRFNRYDRNEDEVINRIELMSSRTAAFRKLDRDGNNLLTFEEWAVATSERFAGADRDRNGRLTRAEFATTRPKAAAKPRCAC